MGGAQQSLHELCATLPLFGIEVAAAVPPGPLYEALRSAGVDVRPIPAVRARRRGLGLVVTLFKLCCAARTVSRVIREVAPDIIHANSVTSALAVGKFSPNTLLFLHVRDLRLPAFALRTVAKRCDRIIAISSAIDAYLRDTLTDSHHRILMLHNGINTMRFAPGDKAEARACFALPADVPVIGMVAHLIPWKGHDVFLSAAEKIRAKNPTAHFVIVGRDLFGEHADWVKQLHQQGEGFQDAVHWVDDLEQTEKILPAFDVLLHPAKNEPFGRVVCEAMAMRVPVVAMCSGGVSDIIRDGLNGFLVDDADGMAERVGVLLDNPERAHELACAARKRIVRKFSKERLARQLANDYRVMLLFRKTCPRM